MPIQRGTGLAGGHLGGIAPAVGVDGQHGGLQPRTHIATEENRAVQSCQSKADGTVGCT